MASFRVIMVGGPMDGEEFILESRGYDDALPKDMLVAELADVNAATRFATGKTIPEDMEVPVVQYLIPLRMINERTAKAYYYEKKELS